MSPYDCAKAAANLANLGFPLEQVRDRTRLWAHRQSNNAPNAIARTSADLARNDQIGAIDTDHLFAAWHYSLYPFLFEALAHRTADKTIYSLIGDQRQAHAEALRDLARSHGATIEFIPSSPAMVRDMRDAIRSGHPGMILLDLPWSNTRAALDCRYPTRGGAFLGRTTTQKLLDAIDPEFQFVTCKREGTTVTLLRPSWATLTDAFNGYGDALADDPSDYERLHQFHPFFEFTAPSPTMILFSNVQEEYLLWAPNMKAWKIGDHASLAALRETDTGLSREPAILDAIKTATGHTAHAVLAV